MSPAGPTAGQDLGEMKVAILAGGAGSRLAEETEVRPKPMVEIGGRPMLWHIMRYYGHYGFRNFVVALGYKGEYIKQYFENYVRNSSNLKIDFKSGKIDFERARALDWTLELIETGQTTLTGGRIKRLAPYLGTGTFMLTWGDGLSNVDLHALLAFHRAHGKFATLTAVRPPARYGHMDFEGDQVRSFTEKPQTAEGWINGAFFVLEPQVFDYIDNDQTMWEHEPLTRLARDGQLMAFKHDAFWQCMDTLREKKILEDMWHTSRAPWRVWQE
jgi:glucose-1-phosphate cytidylyltransferase